MSYLEAEMKANYEPKGIKVSVINMMDYGMMDGKKVLDNALKIMNE